jgi:hypothetical protein
VTTFIALMAIVYAACAFAALALNPLGWTPAMRLIFSGVGLYVLARVLRHDWSK